MKKGRFCGNTSDPANEEVARMALSISFYETREEAWERHLQWLEDKDIRRPKATKTFTVEQLEKMGLVGVYS